jgi:hypothetical protein
MYRVLHPAEKFEEPSWPILPYSEKNQQNTLTNELLKDIEKKDRKKTL